MGVIFGKGTEQNTSEKSDITFRKPDSIESKDDTIKQIQNPYSTTDQNATKDDEIPNYDEPWADKNVAQLIAIDFGSSGFAASFCPPGYPSYQKIVNWCDDIRAASESNKNLAALLIDKATKETIAIGYEAEELYTTAQEKKEDDKYMYFHHFKPYLYSLAILTYP